MLGWGDGYFRSAKENEINDARNMKGGSQEEDQQMRRKVLRELQALVNGSEDDVSDYVTDTEWFYLVSMSHSYAAGVGYLNFSRFNALKCCMVAELHWSPHSNFFICVHFTGSRILGHSVEQEVIHRFVSHKLRFMQDSWTSISI